MCYRDNVPTLELESVHVACLCGDNGHGKTALLDAMTWALWGWARGRDRHYEELVHQGRQDMSVELEFMARDQRYRVSRKYSRSGRRGTTLLELQVVTDSGLRAISGNTVTETEKVVRDILHMDYETFVNTAFLLQGKADSFTTREPARRKEVLAEVLDLTYYQDLEERAKAKSVATKGRIRDIDGATALKKEELTHKQDHEERLASVVALLAQLGPEEEAGRLNVGELQEAVGALNGLRNERDAITRRLAEGQSEISSLAWQVSSHETRVAGYEEALRTESETRERFGLLEEARAEQERLDGLAFRARSLDGEKAELSGGVAVQRERLLSRAKQRRRDVDDDLKPKADRIREIEDALGALDGDRARVASLQEEVRGLTDEAQSISARMRYLEESRANLKTGMDETRQKFDMLDQDDPLCPLCKKPLGAEGQEHLRVEYEAQGQQDKSLFKKQGEEHAALTRSHGEQAAQVAGKEAELERRRREVDTGAAALERDKVESLKAEAELGPALRDLAQLELDLKEQRYALQEQERLGQIDGELSALGYDDQRHRQVQEQVKQLTPCAEAHRRLLDATEALPAARQALETSRELLRRRQRDLDQDERRQKELAGEIESLPSLEAELSSARSRHKSLQGQVQQAMADRLRSSDQLDRLAVLEAENKQLERSRRALLEEMGVHDDLARAFGKNGVQALIIETAIPQLQDDANELLGRLTDGRMSLKLQLHEGRKVKGLPSEELQILIGDEIGTRSYETFSGGETFRVNFALRIALSKLLARRSGAPLPTLFIDEGFGSQDSAGQERLKEAIQSIQSDFQKIIVITHVEEVKDSFPNRIEVTKTADGSTFVAV